VIPNIVTKRMSPTASLNIHSPDITVTNLGGILDFVMIVLTAIGSVGEIRAPKTKQ